MDPALQYAAALLGTIAIETALARVLAPGAWKRLRVDTPLLNLLSHPLLTLVVWNGVLSVMLEFVDMAVQLVTGTGTTEKRR